MRGVWREFRDHRLAAALFMAWWLALTILNFIVSRRTQELVGQLHFVPPVIAGALICWWRRFKLERITGGTLAGSTVLVLNFALMLPRELADAVARGEGLLGIWRIFIDVETLVFAAFGCIFGATLGFLGALAVVMLAHLGKRWPGDLPDSQSAMCPPSSAAAGPADLISTIHGRRAMPREMLTIGSGLVLLATAILAPLSYGRAVPPPAPFTTWNVLIAITLFAPISRWSDDAGRALVLIAGLLSFSLGAGMSLFAGLTWAERSVIVSVAFSVGALAELGTGVLALIAAFRNLDVHYAA